VLPGTSIIPHRPVQRLPEKVCLSPTLPAGHHAPTLTTHPGAGEQRPTTAADVGKTLSMCVDVPSPGVSGDVVCRDEGTRKRVKTWVAYSPEETDPLLCPATARPPRTQGKERKFEHVAKRHTQRGRGCGGNKDHGRKSGGRRSSWNLVVVQLLTAMLLLVAGFATAAADGTGVAGAGVAVGMSNRTDVLQRARALSGTGSGFTPVDSAALKTAVQSCLGETDDGSCPTFAASNDATGNPYGVMGDWDVSKVTSLLQSTFIPPSCFCCCFFHLNSVHSPPAIPFF
jgi:hypothetical protein